MAVSDAALGLAGLSLGDAFGHSLLAPEAEEAIRRRQLPAAPWRWTDDTQTALSVFEELGEREWIDQDYLARRMAWRYTIDPARGYGTGSRQVLERIAHGEYFRSVTRSASYGCSSAARAVPVGGFFAGEPFRAVREARLSVAVTHAHPEALAAAGAVAFAAALAARTKSLAGADFLREVLKYVPESLVRRKIEQAADLPPGDLARAVVQLDAGANDTVLATVPFALWVAAHHLNNFKEALWCAVSPPGPRDTICALVGGIVALAARELPEEWLKRREPLPSRHVDRLWPSVMQVEETRPAAGSQLGQHVSIRVDALTGLPNLLGLLDWAEHEAETGEPACPFSLICIHLVALWEVNRVQGHTAGDDLLRSVAAELRQDVPGTIFRMGGKFVILVKERDRGKVLEQALRIREAWKPRQLPFCRTAVLHFEGAEEVSPGKVLACLYTVMTDRYYENNDGMPREFTATVVRAMPDFPWMSMDLAAEIQRLGRVADESLRLSETDTISQLPNMRAALNALNDQLERARDSHEPLAVLMIDGDNLRKFNQISYEAGDEVIRKIGETLKAQLRKVDFLARWRTGDEFLVLLSNTGCQGAAGLGQRFCRAVEEASRSWLYPTSISIGAAVYPDHGRTVQDLINLAEEGLKAAKEGGKNRVVLAKAE